MAIPYSTICSRDVDFLLVNTPDEQRQTPFYSLYYNSELLKQFNSSSCLRLPPSQEGRRYTTQGSLDAERQNYTGSNTKFAMTYYRIEGLVFANDNQRAQPDDREEQ